MSKRSEKEARQNADLVALLAPALAVTAMLSYFQYRALKKQFLSGAQVKRIDDPEAHTPILAISTLGIVFTLWGFYAFTAWAFRGHAAFIPVAALAVYGVWLLIRRLLAAQAACLLGVVVDQRRAPNLSAVQHSTNKAKHSEEYATVPKTGGRLAVDQPLGVVEACAITITST